jgi:uncharacterized membrane protein YdbT with pleckstrin-like domain
MTLQASAAGSDGEEVLFEGRPALLPDLGQLLLCLLTAGLWLIPLYLRSLGTHYRVTTRRVVVETGVLSKRLEQVDLYRISDYAVERPFLQRLLGTGNLLLTTLDKSSPEIALRGLKTDVVALYERLRVATEAEKQRRAVRVVDYE